MTPSEARIAEDTACIADLTAQRDTALSELSFARAEIERVKKTADDLSERAMAVAFDKVDLTEALSALQRENEALRKTVAQREEHLRDIATISESYKS